MDPFRRSQDSVSDIGDTTAEEISSVQYRNSSEIHESEASLFGSDEPIDGPEWKACPGGDSSKLWPVSSNELPQSSCGSRALLGLWSALAISVPLAFMGLGIATVSLDNVEVKNNSWGTKVTFALQKSATIYPILFAAVIGQAARSTARFTLERGARIVTLETLMGSQTVTSTISTLFQLRTVCFTSAFLIILWTLSPLGGFGFAQILRTTDEWSNSTQNISYLSLNSPNWLGWQLNDNPELPPQAVSDGVDALYKVSVSNWDASERNSQDSMGNVKIPIFEALNGTSGSANPWIYVPAEKDIAFSSLLGVPAFDEPAADNYSFTLQSSYFRFNCGDIRTFNPSDRSWVYQLGNYWRERAIEFGGDKTGADLYPMFNCSEGEIPCTSTFFLDTHTNLSDGVVGAINITFGSLAWPQGMTTVTLVNCLLGTTSVESRIHCSIPGGCSVTQMRQSKMNGALDEQPYTMPNYINVTMSRFFSVFPKASIGTLENFITQKPFNMGDGHPNWTIGCETADKPCCTLETFERRFGILFNSYWGACYGLSFMAAHVPSVIGSSMSTTASIVTCKRCYATNFFWICTIFFSITFLLVVSIAGTILRFRCISPDILGYVSSHTRDNPYIPLPPGGCALDGMDRSRLLKDLRVQVKDVNPGSTVGHIAIAAIGCAGKESEEALEELVRNRSYAGYKR